MKNPKIDESLTLLQVSEALSCAFREGRLDDAKALSDRMKALLTAGQERHRTTKAECMEHASNYHAYAQTVNPHVVPTKGVSSGTWGNDFEEQVKLAFGNYRFIGIAKRKNRDTFKKVNGIRLTFEIKTGAGELAVLDREGNRLNDELTADYIVYSPFYNPQEPVGKQGYIIPADDFVGIFGEGLIRKKQSTAMIRQVKNGIISPEDAYYDRLTIQTYSNSKVKTEALLEALSGYDTIEEWIEEYL